MSWKPILGTFPLGAPCASLGFGHIVIHLLKLLMEWWPFVLDHNVIYYQTFSKIADEWWPFRLGHLLQKFSSQDRRFYEHVRKYMLCSILFPVSFKAPRYRYVDVTLLSASRHGRPVSHACHIVVLSTLLRCRLRWYCCAVVRGADIAIASVLYRAITSTTAFIWGHQGPP